MRSSGDMWIFGYGSLMWRPGFDFAESHPALIRGYHRRLCVISHVHRGTPEMPGLVLGLDRGGSCHGMAFRVEKDQAPATLDYLRAREQVTSVYREAVRPVLLKTGAVVRAVTYLVDGGHRQYAGKMDDAELLRLVRQGRGISGACTDYVSNTLAHLRDMKIHDDRLEMLGRMLEVQAGSISEGAPNAG